MRFLVLVCWYLGTGLSTWSDAADSVLAKHSGMIAAEVTFD